MEQLFVGLLNGSAGIQIERVSVRVGPGLNSLGLFFVCRACSASWRCKSSTQPDGGEVLAKRKSVAARQGFKEASSKVVT
jgi:hypothetical protein